MERQQTERGEVVLVEDEKNKVSEDSAVAVCVLAPCGCHASWSTSAVVTVGDVCGPEKDVFVLQLS